MVKYDKATYFNGNSAIVILIEYAEVTTLTTILFGVFSPSETGFGYRSSNSRLTPAVTREGRGLFRLLFLFYAFKLVLAACHRYPLT